MASTLPTMQLFHFKDVGILNVILHGSSEGIDSDFMQKIIKKSCEAKRDTIAFNFPYMDRKDTSYSGDLLQEEQESLDQVLQFARADEYKAIHFIGKSLGAIVASFYLKSHEMQNPDITITILGYVIGAVDVKKFPGKIFVVQGELDRNGGAAEINKDLQGAMSKHITITEIPNGDHSFKDPKTKQPLYRDLAIGNIQF